MRQEFITNDEMDSIAESVLLKAGIPISWQGNVEKINIESIIEFEYGLDIVWDNIDHLSRDGDVLAAISPKRKIIYMNEAKKDLFKEKMGTMNFSKAHELGHWILHVTELNDYEQLSFTDNERFFCRGGVTRSSEEIQADMFAASILLPKNIVIGAVNQIKEREIVGFPALYSLKDKFEVSITALTKRIKNLGLLYFQDKKVYSSEAEATGQMSLF